MATPTIKISKLRMLLELIDSCETTQEVREAFDNWEDFKAELPAPCSLDDDFAEIEVDESVPDEVADDDIIIFDSRNVGYKRGRGRYFFYFGNLANPCYSEGDTNNDKQELLTSSQLTHCGCQIGDHAHVRVLFYHIMHILAAGNIKRFMIGKCSNEKTCHMHMGMQNRFGSKYREKKYSTMVGLIVLDGSKGKMQEKALGIESALRTLLSDDERFDEKLSKSTSGSLVKEASETNYYFLVYVALKYKEET